MTAIQKGEGETGKQYTARYLGSMVGDIHRTLLYGAPPLETRAWLDRWPPAGWPMFSRKIVEALPPCSGAATRGAAGGIFGLLILGGVGFFLFSRAQKKKAAAGDTPPSTATV